MVKECSRPAIIIVNRREYEDTEKEYKTNMITYTFQATAHKPRVPKLHAIAAVAIDGIASFT